MNRPRGFRGCGRSGRREAHQDRNKDGAGAPAAFGETQLGHRPQTDILPVSEATRHPAQPGQTAAPRGQRRTGAGKAGSCPLLFSSDPTMDPPWGPAQAGAPRWERADSPGVLGPQNQRPHSRPRRRDDAGSPAGPGVQSRPASTQHQPLRSRGRGMPSASAPSGCQQTEGTQPGSPAILLSTGLLTWAAWTRAAAASLPANRGQSGETQSPLAPDRAPLGMPGLTTGPSIGPGCGAVAWGPGREAARLWAEVGTPLHVHGARSRSWEPFHLPAGIA